MIRRTTYVCLAVCSMLLCHIAAAADNEGSPTEPRLKRVALFKNGLGFFVREGILSGAQTTVLLGPFAAPSHGTFWVSAPATAGLKDVIARSTMVKGSPVLAKDVQDLMRANVGKEVTIWPSPDSTAPIKGKLIEFAPDRLASPRLAAPYGMGHVEADSNRYISYGSPPYILVKTEDGIVAMGAYTASRVRFASSEVSSKFHPEMAGAELEATLSSPKPGDWLSVSYLAKGITWAPSYLIDISDGKQAQLSAKAEVINEAENLKGTHVDLITGFPNLKYADVFSPIGMKTDLAGFLDALSGTGARPEAMANVMTQAVAYKSMGAGGAMRGGAAGAGLSAEPAPSYGAAVAGQTTEDLFLYPIEDVTLAQGETGYYPLFTETAPYTEFYEWEIPDYINQSDYYTQSQPQPDQREIVWHSIRLTNTTRVPWTTAPAEILKSGQIAGQDVLNYTPANARVTVKITQASSVKAEQTETEVKREQDAVVLYGDHFDRVTIQGELRATNYQDKSISLEIKKTVSGEVKSTEPPAKDTTLAQGLKRTNPVHQLTWTISLKPQESQKITYLYQALIRR